VLSVPCGLPSYVGPWPPVSPGAEQIEPLADLAASTPHAACASEDRWPGRKAVDEASLVRGN
jgi:hypothetical protein